MASRTQLLTECKHALDSFLQSSSAFRIIRTVPVSQPSSPASTPTAKTLFIFDSSFNPPSRAHASLAISALASKRLDKYPKPHRLLLLFSTHNADKGPTPAAFEHRLALMIVFAEDLAARLAFSGEASNSPSTSTSTSTTTTSRLQQESSHLTPTSTSTSPTQAQSPTPEIDTTNLAIDIALTTQPYYNDKSFAITSTTSPPPYPSNPQHIHLTGFDTITRIFAAKYYPNSTPPFAVLDDFFAQHGLRVTVRPDEKSVSDMGAERQLKWGEEVLRAGKLEKEGARKEWAERIEIVEAEEEGKGVSSTKIREAVQRGEWVEVERLTTKGVAGWVREFGLYGGE